MGPRAEVARVQLGVVNALLLRPLTFMNLSGEAVRPHLRKEGYTPSELLLVYDDMDLAFGRVRVRPSGSAGGHRGAASVLAAAGTTAVPRVRVGIGRPAEGVDAAEFVLAPVPHADRALWEETIGRASEAVRLVAQEGIEAAMNRFNRD